MSIDGNEFATVVNSVEVSKYGGGTRSSMYDSIIGMIEQGLVKGKIMANNQNATLKILHIATGL